MVHRGELEFPTSRARRTGGQGSPVWGLSEGLWSPVLDGHAQLLYSRAVVRAHLRWITVACFASWALGPAIGMGLAIHELDHHRSEFGHSHAAESAAVVLHGHLHEDDSDNHSHELVPPSSTPSRLVQHGQVFLAAVTPAAALSWPSRDARASGLPPEPPALAPPDCFDLCVLRL